MPPSPSRTPPSTRSRRAWRSPRSSWTASSRSSPSRRSRPAGEKFDPHKHQAISQVESDQEPNTVVAVLQKGYLLHDRVLRPALVTVAKARAGSASSLETTPRIPTSDQRNPRSQNREHEHGKDHRNRPRHDQLLRGGHGGRQAQGHREQRRRAHHALGRGLHGRRRDPRRRTGQAPGGHQREEHRLRGEAPHRPQVRGEGSPEGHQPHALQDRRRPTTATPGWKCAARRSRPSRFPPKCFAR